LGIEAQQKTVQDFIAGKGWVSLGEFVEVESGKRNDRPELRKALALAKSSKATVIIAKMDRLGRRASYVLNLLDNFGVKFIFAEMPGASELEVGIRAVIAQEEGRMISERTKAALAAARLRGVKLGTYATTLAPINRKAAQDRAQALSRTIGQLRAQGIKTTRGICQELNARGIPAARAGTRWHLQTVHRLLKRINGK
jgi:DNA invertase Pin-like site-specific DNA recombinase